MQDHTEDLCRANAHRIGELNQEIRRAVAVFGGKWKLEILWLLSQRMHRFNELRRALHGITQHMLTAQLRELERDGLVRRTVYPEVPPRVEYEITQEALRLRPVFEAIFEWMQDRRNGAMVERDGGGVSVPVSDASAGAAGVAVTD